MSYTFNGNLTGRPIVYPDQVPFDTDILREAFYRSMDIANLAQAVLGLPATFGGNYPSLSSGICTQQASPNMTVQIGVCTLYSLQQAESQAYGNVGPVTTPLVFKQFSNMTSISSSTFGSITAPVSNSQYYLIQGTPTTSQINSVNRPYYNSSDPAAPNFAAANDTEIDSIVFAVVPGMVSANPVPPSPTGSGIGMFLILVNSSTTMITNSMISGYPGSFISTPLPLVPSSVQNSGFSYIADTGAANTLVISPTPKTTAYAAGLKFQVLVNHTNTAASTINVWGLGAKSIVLTNGNALSGSEMTGGGIYELQYDGTNFELLNPNVINNFTNVTEFNAGSGNYTVPSGIYKIRVKAWGPGGGGAGGSVGVGGGGGSSGGFCETELSVVPGQVIAYVVGAGGAGGATTVDGSDGSADTTFGSAISCAFGKGGLASGLGGPPPGTGTGLYCTPGFAGCPGIIGQSGGNGGGPGGAQGTLAGGGVVITNSGGGGAGGFGATSGSAGAGGVIYVIY